LDTVSQQMVGRRTVARRGRSAPRAVQVPLDHQAQRLDGEQGEQVATLDAGAVARALVLYAATVRCSAGTIAIVRRSAPRRIATADGTPMRSAVSRRWRSSTPETVSPANATMTSPSLSPAAAAGLSGSTDCTRTPDLAPNPLPRPSIRLNAPRACSKRRAIARG